MPGEEPICVSDHNHDGYGLAKGAKQEPRSAEREKDCPRGAMEALTKPKSIPLKFTVSDGGTLPTKARKSDAGIDIYTNIQHPYTLHPGDGYTFPTGVRGEIPEGYCILLRDRSSLGSKLVGSLAGVWDCEYRGEFKVTLANHGRYPYTVQPGDKIVQGILSRVIDCEITEVAELTQSDRGNKGHGSSGR